MVITVTIVINSPEDEELAPYVKETILHKPPRVSQTIFPRNYLFKKLNPTQQKLFILFYYKEKTECPICYDIITNNNQITTNCNHIFCKNCTDIFLSNNRSCPYCRNTILFYDYNVPNMEYCSLIFVQKYSLFNMIKYIFYSRYPMLAVKYK
jgi:hypothetical protein